MSAVVIAALVVTFVVSDVQVRRQLNRTQAALASARSQVRRTLRDLSLTSATLAQRTGQRDSLQLQLDRAAGELSAVSSHLSDSQLRLFIAGLNLGAVTKCLNGVSQALNQIAVGDHDGAITSLTSVQASCQQAQGGGGSPGGAAYPFDFADPFVLRVGNIYYAYATNSAGGNIQVIRSTDLHNWALQGGALPKLAEWALPNATWAPSVLRVGNTYVLYYTADYGLTGRHCISAAVSSQPQGPFVDNSIAPVTCQLDRGGSIDPSPYVDGQGNPYLAWKAESLGGQPQAIWAQPLSPDGLSTSGSGPSQLIQADQPWEGGVVEAPAMLPTSGGYVLMYSGNNWDTSSYAIGAADCEGPLGPCSKPVDHPVMSSQGAIAGPGGPAVVTDPLGGTWLAFHAWTNPEIGYPYSRLLYIRQLTIAFGIPVIGAPA